MELAVSFSCFSCKRARRLRNGVCRESKNEEVQHSREPRKGDARVVENLWAGEKVRTQDTFCREGTR